MTFFVCRPTAAGVVAAPWFCGSHLLQFIATVVLPFVALMLWQNAVIPAVSASRAPALGAQTPVSAPPQRMDSAKCRPNCV